MTVASERAVVALAASAWLGATLALPIPWWVAGVVVLAAAIVRRPVVGCLALALVVDLLAVRSLDGLRPPPDGPFEGTIELLTDPAPQTGGGLRFEAGSRHGRVLVDVTAPGAVAPLHDRLAGDRVVVAGSMGDIRTSAWSRSRHLTGTLSIERVDAVGRGAAHHRAANGLRRVLDRGAMSLDPTHRSLLAGLVLGDDRAQPAELTADFRAAGLTHLLAVSGQNVLFVLVVVGPVLRRVHLWPRFVLAVGVVAAFAMLTRFEPSVLRAAFVAAVALFARTIGRPSGGLRHLALAVCALLLVDPLLVHSLGFRLSVAATTGVLVVAPRIVDALAGPRWWRDGLGVTTGAQLAVAPVLIPVLGPMPVAALPANVLAGPVAGGLMVWGVTAGTVAGVVGGRVAWLLHRPSAIGLGALEAISRVGAALPLGTVDLRHIAVLALTFGAASVVRHRTPLLVGAVASVVLASSLTPVTPGAADAGWNATAWVDGRLAVVDIDAGADPVAVVEHLRNRRVAAVGLIVVRTAQRDAVEVVDAIRARFPVGAVVGPPGLAVDGAVVARAGMRMEAGRFEVTVDSVGPPLRARIGWVRS